MTRVRPRHDSDISAWEGVVGRASRKQVERGREAVAGGAGASRQCPISGPQTSLGHLGFILLLIRNRVLRAFVSLSVYIVLRENF